EARIQGSPARAPPSAGSRPRGGSGGESSRASAASCLPLRNLYGHNNKPKNRAPNNCSIPRWVEDRPPPSPQEDPTRGGVAPTPAPPGTPPGSRRPTIRPQRPYESNPAKPHHPP